MASHPWKVALTGGIATGKSRCLAAAQAVGLATVDADQLARDVVAPGTPGHHAVIARFGSPIATATGEIDREALGQLVFSDSAARKALEDIIHPLVYAAIEQWFAALDAPLGVADVPLLFETGRQADFDVVVVAACSPRQQLERLMSRSGLSEADAQARINAQWPIADKAARADYEIDTSGTLAQTDDRARQVWLNLKSRPRPR